VHSSVVVDVVATLVADATPALAGMGIHGLLVADCGDFPRFVGYFGRAAAMAAGRPAADAGSIGTVRLFQADFLHVTSVCSEERMERRSNPRTEVNQEVDERAPATPIRGKVLDLSASGCLMETDSALVIVGRTVLLALSDTVEVAGSVVRKSDHQVGIEFAEPLKPDVLSYLLNVDRKTFANGSALRDGFDRQLPPLGAKFRPI
jgi:hypothetical protein